MADTPDLHPTASVQSMREDFPEVSENIWNKVDRAPGFETGSSFNEQNVFESMWREAVQQYMADASDVKTYGRLIPELFVRWKDVTEQWVRYALRGDADDPLDATLNWDPEGGGEALLRPIRPDSFGNAQYRQTPTSTGRFNLIPDDTQGDDSTETATENEQAWIILGYAQLGGNAASSPVEYIQSDVNDNIGVRRELYARYALDGRDTLGILERHRGPLLVEPGFDLDIDVDIHTANQEMQLWPLGFEVVRADATEFGGVQDA